MVKHLLSEASMSFLGTTKLLNFPHKRTHITTFSNFHIAGLCVSIVIKNRNLVINVYICCGKGALSEPKPKITEMIK